MKKVLWISRHEMTTAQLSDLERIMGGTVKLLCWKENVRNVTELMPLIEQAAAIAADRAERRERLGIEEAEVPASQVGGRRYARGRAYEPDRFGKQEEQPTAETPEAEA